MTIPQRLRHNLGLKLLSLAVALLIWGSVRNEANPVVSRHRVVKVEAVDVPPQLAVASIDPSEVTVTLTGRASEFDQLEYSDLRLTASVPQVKPGVQTAMLQPEGLPYGLEIRQMSRNMARVTLDTVVSSTRPVLVEMRGQPARSFAVSGSVVRPGEVTVRGPSSLVQKVARVVAMVDISGRNATIPTMVSAVARDVSSVPLSGLEVVPSEVSVTVNVRQVRTASVPVVPIITNLPSGYEIASVSVKPMAVTLTGSSASLASVESVPTSAINASSARGKATYNVTLRPPAGLSTVGSATAIVTLELRSTRQYQPAPAAPAAETPPAPVAAPRPQPEPPRPADRPSREEPDDEPDTSGADKPAAGQPVGAAKSRPHTGGAGATGDERDRIIHKPAVKTP